MTAAATVAGDDRLRLFLALELPDDAAAELGRWGERNLVHGRAVEAFHVTLAFLGSQPRTALDSIVGVLRREARAADPFVLEPVRYRETRSVGMLVLADPSGAATSLAAGIQTGLEALGVYERERRPWLPHITVARFRERPRFDPPLAGLGPFAPSGAAALLSRLHRSGSRYQVLESCVIGRTRG